MLAAASLIQAIAKPRRRLVALLTGELNSEAVPGKTKRFGVSSQRGMLLGKWISTVKKIIQVLYELFILITYCYD
ncbi:MAG: hypothetical protein KME08_02150 [Aphanothece sp. CMT-3BRIN-NPC111]|nr:hypothetical protein [Aphanothece sp. CMT-3BRIN-NPC111]